MNWHVDHRGLHKKQCSVHWAHTELGGQEEPQGCSNTLLSIPTLPPCLTPPLVSRTTQTNFTHSLLYESTGTCKSTDNDSYRLSAKSPGSYTPYESSENSKSTAARKWFGWDAAHAHRAAHRVLLGLVVLLLSSYLLVVQTQVCAACWSGCLWYARGANILARSRSAAENLEFW